MTHETLLAMPLLIALAVGCAEDGDCTAIACQPSLTIGFPEFVEESGVYTVNGEIDGEPIDDCSLTITLPDPDVQADGCPDELSLTGRGDEVRTANSVGETAVQRLTGIIILGEPSSVSLTIEHDGAVWAAGMFEPVYAGVEINGPGCGECPMAVEAFP